jgi:hypothetical protein
MKIVETNTEESMRTSSGKIDVVSRRWLFDIENGNVNLFVLMNMRPGQQAIVDLKDFKELASDEEMRFGIDRALNWTFLQGNLPLIARSENDKIVIKKTEEHIKAIVIFE